MGALEGQSRWRWLLNRLRCMSPAEVAHRGRVAVAGQLRRRLGGELIVGRKPEAVLAGAQWLRVPAGIDAAAYVDEARLIAAGSVRLFAQRRFEVGPAPDWNRCPRLGVRCPPLPARSIDLTDPDQVGDIKYVWELNRHLHWVVLAQAWALTRDEEHLQALGRQLRSWLDQCPFGQGPNWTSSLEYALRLLNWSLVWQLIGGPESPLFAGPEGQVLRERWLAAIDVHT
ncbi:heparinase II/III family protein, partial [Pelomonas sp. KK5]|uniref:heparinase II/III family protein n=1 Tax=Pelomonas sp. KK5 TaxID=1855730 RepID=UPI0026F4287F